MTLWPQFKSPLVWDFFAILAYVISSVLFWYLGILPDLASVRDQARTRPRQPLRTASMTASRTSLSRMAYRSKASP